jgi:peptidoglycan/xylan/chitin deacetylase (PgdA/CDA1 family)
LDFELHWGVRDHSPVDGSYRDRLLGARTAAVALLDLFAEHDVAATWATVGFLFARNRDEMAAHRPELRPQYADPRLDPWREAVGIDEQDDPLHFAPSLIQRILQTPRQELASHTLSHFYCGAPGATPAAFEADLDAAQELARTTTGATLQSLVFPRNQADPEFVRVLPRVGIHTYRGNPPGPLWGTRVAAPVYTMTRRVGRILDTYLPLGDDSVAWQNLPEGPGVTNVRASRFLRPYDRRLAVLEPLRLRRVVRGLESAARRRRVYHLWWHPHNFGAHLDENLRMLRRVLVAFAQARERHGMVSLTMDEAARLATGTRVP